ncbi:uncharacterized protein LOC144300597 isoform X5 [Canis aureus]
MVGTEWHGAMHTLYLRVQCQNVGEEWCTVPDEQGWSSTGERANNFPPNLDSRTLLLHTDERPHEQIASPACPESPRLLANGFFRASSQDEVFKTQISPAQEDMEDGKQVI